MVSRVLLIVLLGVLAASGVACVPPPTDPAPLPAVDVR
jgi:hypothetical protein